MRFSQLFFRFVYRNCLIFGTKVNLDNTYPLEILKLFGKFLIPSNPLNPLKKAWKLGFSHFSWDWFIGIVWFLEIKSIFLRKTVGRDPARRLVNIIFNDFSHLVTLRSISEQIWLRRYSDKIFKIFESQLLIKVNPNN